MPNLTVTHEATLELIRQHPALAVDLLRAFTGLVVHEQADIRLGPNSLNAIVPADWVESFVNEGIAKGAVSAKVTHLMKVLAVRDLHPTKKQLARVAGCTDLAMLDRWFDRSLTAANAAEVFAD